jgi:hypothetical protein
MPNHWRQKAIGLLLFGVTFGYLEASVVVYLRTMYEPIRFRVNPNRNAGDLFPLTTREQLRAAAPETVRLVEIEVVREAATLMMLLGVAFAASTSWLPAFAVAFGTWDLFYYVFLRVLTGWPASLLTWDVLFLLPVPWSAPVLAPVIVSLSIIATGLIALRCSVPMRLFHWGTLTLGGLLIVLSFVCDFPNIVAGGLPHPFAWGIFAAGELLGLGTFIHAVQAAPARTPA